jgi:glutamate formiminotransferase
MTVRVLEAVPNFSEGRDLRLVQAIADAMRAAGADVLDWTADREHHRSVITVAGAPELVEEAAVAGARVAMERIDLRGHAGVHPRIGAVDVMPFVPLAGLTLDEAKESAHRVGRRIALELGIPVYYYAHASDPPGRGLAELRRGGFEAIAGEWPAGRKPDMLPPGWPYRGAHPTAGAVCVGARNVLLAWNVNVRGLALDTLKDVARGLRESGGGFAGLRALAFRLAGRESLQLSMNLENVETAAPMAVFARIEADIAARGGRIESTEIIGLVPDRLVLDAAAERLRLAPGTTERMLSRRLVSHLVG